MSGEKLLEGTNASETDVTSEEFFYVDVCDSLWPNPPLTTSGINLARMMLPA